jgi:thiamine-phosphate pyrophosphorylase
MPQNEEKNSIFRILDAANNRTGEGLRVVEDYVRMVLGDAFLSKQLKQLRHDLAQAMTPLDLGSQILARDSEGDVGRNLQTATEYERSSDEAILKANLTRVQQSLRAIEEFTKTIDASVSQNVEQLRYRSYTLEKAIMLTRLSLQSLKEASLYVLIDGTYWKQSPEKFEAYVTSLIDAKVDLIQFRDKELSDKDHVAIGKRLTLITRPSSTRWIMNDRADLAVATDADGVHLGQDDISVSDGRRLVGASKLIGVSTHDIEQARQAVIDGANYIGVGPVFPSTTKNFDSHVGLELVSEVANEIKLPAFAIGGINGDNIEDVVKAGFCRVAVSAAVSAAEDPRSAAKALKSMLAP